MSPFKTKKRYESSSKSERSCKTISSVSSHFRPRPKTSPVSSSNGLNNLRPKLLNFTPAATPKPSTNKWSKSHKDSGRNNSKNSTKLRRKSKDKKRKLSRTLHKKCKGNWKKSLITIREWRTCKKWKSNYNQRNHQNWMTCQCGQSLRRRTSRRNTQNHWTHWTVS